jgi:hypothetical protein
LCHPNKDGVRLRPSLGIQRDLCGKRSVYCIPRVVEGCTERIASGFEDVAALCVNAIAQYFVMSGERHPHRIMVCFPQPRAALNVGEQERYCARWQTGGTTVFRSHGVRTGMLGTYFADRQPLPQSRSTPRSRTFMFEPAHLFADSVRQQAISVLAFAD